MALNYSHQHVFPAHISENNLLRTANEFLAEGVSDKYGNGYPRPCHESQGEMEDWNFSCGKDKIDRCCSPESSSNDIVDLLSSDPFGMDIETTFTAITGWLQDLEVDYTWSNGGRTSQENYGLFAGWNLIWNSALLSQSFSGAGQSNERLSTHVQSFSSCSQVYEKPDGVSSMPHAVQFDETQFDETLNEVDSLNKYDVGEVDGSLASYGMEPDGFHVQSREQSGEVVGKVEGAAQSEVPHDAFKFCLLYLELKDLLSVERVCKSLYSEVRGDPLLWKSIRIDFPLNEKITDDLLLQLARRANGDLRCLSLVECPKITDDGIERILELNPRLTKLFVPGCTKLTIEGLLNNIRAHNSNKNVLGIKQLRIGNLYAVKHGHFEELKFLLGIDSHKFESDHKQRFYYRGNFYLPHDDNRAIDIEMCPKCEKFRLVYDCPAEGCQTKDKSSQVCRACTLCIARCAQCGTCVNNNEYEETFCLDLLCSDCYKQVPT